MGRYRCNLTVKRDRGETGKQDTPMKTAVSRRNEFRKLPPIRHHEIIQEEPEQEVSTVKAAKPTLNLKPIHSESAMHGCTNTSKGIVSSSAAPVKPAGRTTIQRTLNPRGPTCITTPVQEKSPVRPEVITSSSTESDVTLSSDDDDWGESSSSHPSPEIFRKESYVETLTFSVLEDCQGHHPYMKNSTLLDVSHAESIHMYHPPNLSTIIDGSSILSEKNCEISPLLGPEVDTKLKTVSLKPVKPSLTSGTKTQPKLTNRRPISYKKKVWFKSPIISDTFGAKFIPAKNITPHEATEPIRTTHLTVENTSNAETSRAGESNLTEGVLHLKSPEKRSPETAKFFDFDTETDEEMFFQMMRDRRAKLSSVPLFPLTAVKPKNSVLVKPEQNISSRKQLLSYLL